MSDEKKLEAKPTTSSVPAENKNREFLINKNITAENVEAIIKGILEINRYDEKQEEKNSNYIRKPIKVIVDSYGGHIYCGTALIGIIDSSETPVHTYCYGKAMSMGFAIFASGHKRFAHRLATFMYHDAGSAYGGTTEQIRQDIAQLQNWVDHMEEYILSLTNLPRRKLEEVRRMKQDWFMFAEEAMSYGLVDELIESKRNKYNK